MTNILLALAAVLILAILPAGAAMAADPTGDWTSVVTVTPTASYRVAIHIHRNADGAYAGTYDSLDRAIYDAPLADITVNVDSLSLTVPSVTGRLQAKWDQASRQWTGEWVLGGKPYQLSLARGVYPPNPSVPGLDGEWDGALDAGGSNLRLAFHIKTGARGTVATFDSVDQGAYGGAVSSIGRDGDHVRLEMKQIGASFDADLTDGGQMLAGQFAQGGATFLLQLERLPPGVASPWPRGTSPSAPATPANWTTPSDADIHALLARRIDAGYRGAAMVVGVIDAGGRRIVAYGVRSAHDPKPPDGDTVFEIGSITKSFTGLILADMIDKAEVRLDDPVAKFLPPDVTVPSHGGKQITLADLATNTSGLPDNPRDVAAVKPADPYAGYEASAAQLFALLKQIELSRDPGVAQSHSNIGVGLLGLALARRAGQSYAALVETRVTRPLGMTSTAVTPTADMRARRLTGLGPYLRPAPDIVLGDLAGAGALNSTANDMLDFLAAELGVAASPLGKAMATQISAVRRPMGGQDVALEIIVSKPGDLVWTNGGTFGFQSFMGFDPKRRVGVVVLANVGSGPRLTDDIGLHILGRAAVASLPAPSLAQTAITLPPTTLEHYVGRYQLAPQVFLAITRTGDSLYAQLTGQGVYEIFPESSKVFFYKIVDARLSFVVGAGDQVAGLVLHQNGRDLSATRVP
jgi:D-alanyl-D-alanine-carboxypeptidase/D-alanyl-D-alanine-endopeptidase